MKTTSNESRTHAKLSASGSERWLECPGSVALSEDIPEGPESEYAVEGTDAHACHEFLLKNRKNWKQALTMAEKRWNAEMIQHAKHAIEFITYKAKDRDCEILCETRVDLSFVREGMFGTVDAAIVEEFGTLDVFDYKYGAGVPVDADDNSQLAYYGLGIAHKYGFNFQEVVLHVLQPRADHDKGPYRSWKLSIEELMVWEERFRLGAEATEDPLAPLKTGDHCRWCPAKAVCPEISNAALRQAQVDFAPEASAQVVLPVAQMIPPQVLSNTLKGIEKLEMWIEAVKEHALFTLKRGAKVPGFKLVKKRSTRKWINTDKTAEEAIKKFGEDAFTDPELKSPAQFEKTFGEDFNLTKWLAKRTTSESSGVTVVDEKDSRPAVNLLQEEFPQESLMPVKKISWNEAEKLFPRKGVKVATKAKPKKKTAKRKTK